MGLYTFITFKGNISPQEFESKLSNIENKYYPDFMKNRHNYSLTKFKGSHLNPTLGGDLTPAIAPVYLWILAAIAIGILVIACLNFVNISIANAGKRSIETGIKKANGASFTSIMWDYLSEITLFVFISLIIACLAVFILIPSFNNLVGKDMSVNFSDTLLWGGAFGFGILTILISGIYPAIVLSRPSAVQVLLNNRGKDRTKMTFQRSLVVFQFAITIVLATAQLFIFKQISFMQNHETGFVRKNLITIPVRALGGNSSIRMKNTTLFVEDLEKHQSQYGFGKASITEFVPGFGYRNFFKLFASDDISSNGIEMLSSDVDENFKEVFGLNNLHGRFFSKEFSTDKNAIVINESAFKKLGWKTIDGKSIALFSKNNIKKVVGVVNDINIKSMQYSVEPAIYQFGRHHNYPGYITLKLNPEAKSETIEFLKNKWTTLFPDIPFGYESIEEKYLAAYGEEERLARITGIFSLLAMLLSLFGIFALSTIESEKRTKEIGVRKVNGARISEILQMLNKGLIKWVAIAFVIATPLAYFAMNKWLENFAYKTSLSWWIFAFAGLLVLGIALLTVSWQSWKAATRNPVEALRYE
jgi:putative ABC transport system permease protein